MIGLAVLFAPAVTSAAAARAGVPDHQVQMMESGHCTFMPTSGHDKPDGHSCCVSLFLGLTAALSSPLVELTRPAARPISFVPTLHGAYLGEIATPPPRQA
jgi:hypothetical protein